MQTTAIINGTTLINGRLVPRAVVLLREGRIAEVGRARDITVPEGARRIDAAGHYVAPGFVDIHIHGSGGFSAEAGADGMARHVIRNGTTWFLPTFISNELDAMHRAIEHVAARVGPVARGATIGGIHLEGPFLNPRYGAQQPKTNIAPDAETVRELIRRCGPHLRLVTIAPELPGAVAAIQAFRAAGAVVSIGHSDATESEYAAGRAAGISHATHIFNAMPVRIGPEGPPKYAGLKAVGIEELILADDEVTADIMCDATAAHVHPAMMRVALKCKGVEKLSLITDAMISAGLPCGEYTMADGQRIVTTPGEDVARLANGSLCGSVLSMRGALCNCIKHTGLPLAAALTMVSEAPARAVGVFAHKGSIAPGKDADLVIMDRALAVREVLVAGKTEFRAEDPGHE